MFGEEVVEMALERQVGVTLAGLWLPLEEVGALSWRYWRALSRRERAGFMPLEVLS